LGSDVREIQILPDELIRYGAPYAKKPTVPMLDLLAMDKARGWIPLYCWTACGSADSVTRGAWRC
jgi:hypothetical protein